MLKLRLGGSMKFKLFIRGFIATMMCFVFYPTQASAQMTAELANSFIGHLDIAVINPHSDSITLMGWACFRNNKKKPWIGIYAPQTDDLQKRRRESISTANLLYPYVLPRALSETAVNNICNNGRTDNRFNVTIPLRETRYFKQWDETRRVLQLIARESTNDMASHDDLRKVGALGVFKFNHSGRVQLPRKNPHKVYEFDSANVAQSLHGEGYIDQVTFNLNNDSATIDGWGCLPIFRGSVTPQISRYVDTEQYNLDLYGAGLDRKLDQTISLGNLFINGKNQYQFHPLFSGPTGLTSEEAVNQICQTATQNNRFSLTYPFYLNDRHYTVALNIEAAERESSDQWWLTSIYLKNSGKIFHPISEKEYTGIK